MKYEYMMEWEASASFNLTISKASVASIDDMGKITWCHAWVSDICYPPCVSGYGFLSY